MIRQFELLLVFFLVLAIRLLPFVGLFFGLILLINFTLDKLAIIFLGNDLDYLFGSNHFAVALIVFPILAIFPSMLIFKALNKIFIKYKSVKLFSFWDDILIFTSIETHNEKLSSSTELYFNLFRMLIYSLFIGFMIWIIGIVEMDSHKYLIADHENVKLVLDKLNYEIVNSSGDIKGYIDIENSNEGFVSKYIVFNTEHWFEYSLILIFLIRFIWILFIYLFNIKLSKLKLN